MQKGIESGVQDDNFLQPSDGSMVELEESIEMLAEIIANLILREIYETE